ncbi:MAG TPA: Mrp/NBP35 family ATP-binding protein [Gemmataceae bacterium]|jgi:ATP-binding protein involved in chromosome partitioning|nr:Mrp/NBP35 family ATP-binding protein [Gemmataceae bacterium]
MQPGPASNPALAGVRHIIAVASGKGGVGKSTVAANLALALQMHGQRVGLMDADIYGPSVPMMMGVSAVDPHVASFPIEKFGLKLMSLGFLPDAGKGVLLRGPMVAKWVATFLTQVNWGDLDYLVIDMPPGTGDAQLTLCQTAKVSGAVIVTTPQDVSLIDAVKALNMFGQLRTPVLGVIENMSYFVGDDGKRYEIFRHGGGQKLATETGVPFLGEVPIDPRVSVCGDGGEPMVRKYPETPVAKAYLGLATAIMAAAAAVRGTELPEVQL